MPVYDYACDGCRLVREEFHAMAEDPAIVCGVCKRGMRKLIGSAEGRPPGKKIVDVTGYQPGLARFPDDPEAYVDGKHSLEKLIYRRRQDGWGAPIPADEVARSGGPPRRATTEE